MQLLQDVFIIEQLQVLTEGKANDIMKIRGVFGRCNERNNNGRVYPTKVFEGQLAKVQPLINERRLCGELDHPSNDTVRLSNASHLITKLEMKGNDLMGEAEVLKTPAGLTAQALINGGVKIGISSRGMGTLSEDHMSGNKIVNEDFRLVTFDLVADPSTRGAYPALSESTESQFVRESQTKLGKESNFVTLLESRMRRAYKPFIEEATAKEQTPAQKDIARAEGLKKIIADREKIRKEKMHQTDEAFEVIKADGHWHRMALALAVALNEDLASNIMSQKPEEEGIGLAAGERRRGMRGHQKAQLKMTQKHAKKMGRIETGQGVRHARKMAKAEGKAGVTKEKYGAKGAKYGARAAETKGRGEGAGIAAKAEGQGAATRTAGQAKGDAAALQAKGQGDATRTAGQAKGDAAALQATGDARAGVTKAQGGVEAKRATDVGGAETKGKVERQTGREAAKTAAQGAVIAAPGKAAGAMKKGAEAVVGGVAKRLPGAAKAAGKVTGAAARGIGALAGKAKEAIAGRQSRAPAASPEAAPRSITGQKPREAPPEAAPSPTGKMDPKAIAAEKAERAGKSADAQKKLQSRLGAVKGEQAASKQSFKTSLGRAKTTGRVAGRLEQDIAHTSYKQIGRMIAEALGWTL